MYFNVDDYVLYQDPKYGLCLGRILGFGDIQDKVYCVSYKLSKAKNFILRDKNYHYSRLRVSVKDILHNFGQSNLRTLSYSNIKDKFPEEFV